MSSPGGRGGRRAIAAAWFGAWGALSAGYFFLDSALGHGAGTVALYVVLPGMAAAAGGAIVGATLLDPDEGGPLEAAALGMLAVVLAHLLYGLLVAAGWWLTGGSGAWALGAAVSIFGFAMMALVTVPVGALAGWLLWALRAP